MTRDVTYELVKYAVGTKYGDLPSQVVKKTKMLLLDALGCCFAGSAASGVRETVDLINEWGGKKESTILLYGHRVPAPSAAFANSVMLHARDLEDTQDIAVIHCTTPIVPAALALAERENASGQDLIVAVALGVELLCRMGLASPRPQRKGWFHTTTLGCMASTIAVGKLLGLTEKQMMNAVGISYSQFAGNQQCLEEKTLTKRLQPAFAARTGVFSALLANKGITGPKNILEGKYGFYNLYLDGQYNHDVIVDHLGKTFEILNLSLKYYPSCRGTHASIDVALSLSREHDTNADEIKAILVYVPPLTNSLVGGPYEIGETPQVDAQFSIPYTVARAFIKRDVFIDDFEDEAVRDIATLNLAKKVKVVVNPDAKQSSSFLPLRMEVKMNDGKIYRRGATTIKGSPQNPMNRDECITKFNKCADFAVNPISNAARESFIYTVGQLEEIDDVNELIKPLKFR